MHRIHLAPAFLLLLALGVSAQDRRTQLENLLRALDRNGDRKISPAEFPRGEERFRRLDRNNDGVLSEEDFGRRPGGTEADAPKPNEPKPATEPAPGTAPGTERAPTPQELDFFEKKIRPVLADQCYGCHSARDARKKGGLEVDSKAAIRKGGATGPAVIPGDPEQSLLLQAVRYDDPALRMPPKGRLPDEVVKDLERWIAMGAPDPRTTVPLAAPGAATATEEKPLPMRRDIDLQAGRKFWSFQPPKKPAPPSTRETSWAYGEIDAFLLAAMEQHGVAPVGDADRRTWLRRVTFDLTGLPPTPEELAAFEADNTKDAYERVVDRLLASPAFGERFGRHWLDVARYAESSGKETNVVFPHAWRYRDYVIDAFRHDKPYDEFLKEQLAGDLLPAQNEDDRAENLVATSFLALGPKGLSTRNRQQYTMDVVDEQIDATTQAMLGLTVACARCHDHKFDPIPTEDYYALAGIFLSSETCYGTMRGPGNQHPSALLSLPPGALLPDGPSMSPEQRRVLEGLRDRAQAIVDQAGAATPRRRPGREAGDAPKEGAKPGEAGQGAKPAEGAATPRTDVVNAVRIRAARDQVASLDQLLARFEQDGRPKPENRLTMGVREAARPRDARVLVRGEVDNQGETVKRGFVRVLENEGTPTIRRGSGRLELAEWIASPQNPLTARVMVNRIWLHLFGAGIVPTPDNFGMSGQPPTHPELLDWLAVTFVEDGWSVKKLVRRCVLSHAYRLAATEDPRFEKVDPDVTWLWRHPERRLEGEAIRDAMLAAGGLLAKDAPVGSPVGTVESGLRAEALLRFLEEDRPIRSVYLPILRDRVPEALEVFDFAEPSFVTGDREETNVATQALWLMNSPDVQRYAVAFARRLLALGGSDDERIVRAFEIAFGRRPSAAELGGVREFFRDFAAAKATPNAPAEPPARGGNRRARPPRGQGRPGAAGPEAGLDPKTTAWAAFCQALFQSAEFRYID